MKIAQNHFLIVTAFTFLFYAVSCSNAPIRQGFAEDEATYIEATDEKYEPITKSYKTIPNEAPEPEQEVVPVSTTQVKPVYREIASITKATTQEEREACLHFELPEQFKILPIEEGRKKTLQVVDSRNRKLAHIEQSVLSAGKFEVRDLKNRIVMTGIESKDKAARSIELYDCTGEKIGRIEQDFEKSFVSASQSFSWLDDNDRILSMVEKKDEYTREVSVTDRNESKWASLMIEKRTKKYEASTKQPATQQRSYKLLATLKLFADGGK